MTKGYQLYDLTPSVTALLFRNSVAFRARVLLDHILGQFDPGILVNSNCQQMMVDISGGSYSLKKCYQYVMQFGFDTSQYCSFWFEAPSPAFKQVRLSLLCPSLLPEIQEPERSLSYPVLAFRVRTHTIHLWYLYQHSAIQHQNGPTDPKWCPTAGCFAVHMALRCKFASPAPEGKQGQPSIRLSKTYKMPSEGLWSQAESMSMMPSCSTPSNFMKLVLMLCRWQHDLADWVGQVASSSYWLCHVPCS